MGTPPPSSLPGFWGLSPPSYLGSEASALLPAGFLRPRPSSQPGFSVQEPRQAQGAQGGTNRLGARTCLPPSVFKSVRNNSGNRVHFTLEFLHREHVTAKLYSTQNNYIKSQNISRRAGTRRTSPGGPQESTLFSVCLRLRIRVMAVCHYCPGAGLPAQSRGMWVSGRVRRQFSVS